MTGVCITGTDTGVGKTRVTCAMIHALSKHLRVAGFKPVAAGAERIDGVLVNEDARLILQAMDHPLPYDRINPICLQAAIAPHIAAAREGVTIEASRLIDAYRSLTEDHDLVVLEGAGGWMVPMSRSWQFPELIRRLGLPVIVVVGMRLGCLNHSLLSIAAIEQAGLEVAGWVANHIDPDMASQEDNLETLRTMIDAPLLARYPYDPQADLATIAKGLQIDLLGGLLGAGQG